MSKELALNPLSIDQHLELLEARLSEVPELQPAFVIVDGNREHARDVYSEYVQLTKQMSQLNDAEIERIKGSQEALRAKDGTVGSASKIGANDILLALGKRRNLLVELADQSTNPTSPYYNAAVDVLVGRLEGGHNLKLSGKSPSDFDPESLKVIWGHTVITGPEALLHFTVCHYLERFMAEGLFAQGVELARQKDFFINALVDVVILDKINSQNPSPIFDIWVTPKEQGGLGWITQDRLKSYSLEA